MNPIDDDGKEFSTGLVEFPQPPVLWCKFPDLVNLQIKNYCIDFLQKEGKTSKNTDLAGNLERQYDAPYEIGEFLFDKVDKTLRKYITKNTSLDFSDEKKFFELDSCWINYQKKHEFNPLHFHSGLFSFVYWTEIPYNIDDEMNLKLAKNSNCPCPSMFSFCYTNILGRIVQKTFNSIEGLLFIFPASMLHQVYPFYTSDQYRISISGNINSKDYPNCEISNLLDF